MSRTRGLLERRILAVSLLTIGLVVVAPGVGASSSNAGVDMNTVGFIGGVPSPGASTETVQRAPNTPVTHVELETPNGAAGWVANSYLLAHPNFLRAFAHTQATPVVGIPAGSRVGGRALPDSHFGCNKDVCINVVGHSTVVTHWSTQANGGGGLCTRATFWFPQYPGHAVGPLICSGPDDGVFYDNGTDPKGTYKNGDRLCNSWDHLNGLPCAQIIQK